ncbi:MULTISPECIES: AAA family ATPase [Pseudoalteromonas]|uniref:AAA family ATPase n=1 Tax=Pseudoalteromonas TaxID=53246 RepID=UPI001583FECE|nr:MULTISPECIES: AAA family ATPase [Pseudoalteromonas]MDI4651788.1 ATP-binding protein [Pseudoalteromonas shioyasakiensis]NUJ38117.1 AAA family ATPase [Pseudoalteromonas sp. 0303]
MELVCIYIDEYKGIKDLFVNLNQKFICDFDKPHIHVKKQHCKFKEKYYRGQNIKLIIGKNGAGKTSILEFIEGAFNEIVGIGTAVFWNDIDSKYYIKNNSLSEIFLNDSPINEYESNNRSSLLFITNLFDLNKFTFNEHSKEKKNVLKLSSNKFLEKRVAKKKILMAEVARELKYAEYFNYKKSVIGAPLSFRFHIYPSSKNYLEQAVNKLTNENVSNLLKNRHFHHLVMEEADKNKERALENNEITFSINNISREHQITGTVIKKSLTKYLLSNIKNHRHSDDVFWYIHNFLISDFLKKASLKISDPNDRAWFYINIIFLASRSNERVPEIIKYHIDENNLLDKNDAVEDVVYESESFRNELEEMTQSLLDKNISILSDTKYIYFDIDDSHLIAEISEKFNDLNYFTGDNFTYGWYGLSSGEEARLKLQSRIFTGIQQLISRGYSNIQLLVDEIDAYLHPEWQRKVVSEVIDIINHFKDHNRMKRATINTILTTHSPIILSDFLPDDIVSITKIDGKITQEKSNGFGTRINDLYLDGMHLDSTFGELARETIEQLFLAKKYKKISSLDRYLIKQIPDKDIQEMFLKKND